MVITSMSEGLEAWSRTGSNAWASHIPLLKMAGDAESVLELGMGQYSTPMFLDREIFPFLTKLFSVESDPAWAKLTTDARHRVHILPEPIEPLLDTFDLEQFDLIFVDNSDSADRRVATLKYISSRRPLRARVLAHDWERYHDAVTGFRFGILDDRQMPQTALVWGRK